MGFEILQEPEPEDAGKPETRVCVEIVMDRPNPDRNMAYISRRMAAKGSQFTAWQVVTDETADSREKSNWHGSNTAAKTGRLRLTRTGSVLSYLAAEGLDGDFRLLQQFPFGKENLRTIRLVAAPGGPKAAFDVRITDLRIRAESIPSLAQGTPPPAAPAARARPKRGMWAGMLLGLGIAGVLLVPLVWLSLRQRRRTGRQ
jgi:hypothetical protein